MQACVLFPAPATLSWVLLIRLPTCIMQLVCNPLV
ncbi:hypothetical protein EVA_15099 [gut metagenome]|uniref:Uncharacterized protein n=1 Tax=gut metagenome TaxID=749906 RepID=J9FPC1_9ZZZZ